MYNNNNYFNRGIVGASSENLRAEHSFGNEDSCSNNGIAYGGCQGSSRYLSSSSIQAVHNHYNYFYKEQKKEKGEDNMSFVGMRFCKDGIVAWGDSKVSIKDKFGNLYLDKNRGNIQKVFKNIKHQYLLATFGNNTISSQEQNGVMYIENWISKNLAKYETPYLLIDEFAYYVWHIIKTNRDYNFFIACKDEHGWYIQEVYIGENNIILSKKFYGGFLRNPIQVYASSFDSQAFFEGLSCEEFKEQLNFWLLKEIEANNEVCAYNPVGGPIRFETLLFDEPKEIERED